MTDGAGSREHGRSKIGRQIVLPLSKAFEIAWKGMKIRIWRSLITMSGIVLAIAFVSSIWVGGAFDRALTAVPPDHPLYALVQGTLEAQALAGGGARLRCIAVEQVGTSEDATQITPGGAIRDYLDNQEAFRCSRVPAEKQVIDDVLRAGETQLVNALVLVGLPQVVNDPEAARTLDRFVRSGGFLFIYGTNGVEEAAKGPMKDLLPALPASGTFAAEGANLTRGDEVAARGVLWANMPRTEFANTTGQAEAQALAVSDGRTVAWMRPVGAGLVAWYPVTGQDISRADAISWFLRGETVEGEGKGGPTTGLLTRLTSYGCRKVVAASRHDMRGVWLVTLSLMVCVVGITNAMLMSVTERFREIGTMKCLGALDKFIVKLFIIESSLQGVVGSVAGVIIGFLLAFARAMYTYHIQDLDSTKKYWLTLKFFPAWSLLGWMGVALAVGIVLSVVAAVYPAIQAARMEPVQALRSEA